MTNDWNMQLETWLEKNKCMAATVDIGFGKF